MRTLALIFFAAIAGAGDAEARAAGADPFEFLFLDAGARQSALGGAFASGRDDANVMAYNPAGLATLFEHRAAFLHENRFQGVTRERLAAAWRGGFGASLDYLNYGSIQRTTLASPSGAGLDSFTPVSLAAALGYGWPAAENLALGASLKLIRETIDDVTAQGFAFDLGAQTQLIADPGLVVGLAVQNIGPKVRFQTVRENLPLNVKAGLGLRPGSFGLPLAVAAELDHAPGGLLAYHFGLEGAVLERLALRAGFNSRNDASFGVTFGFGLAYDRFNFDYAMVPYGELGISHQIGFGMRWGRPDSSGGELEKGLEWFMDRK